MSREAGLAFWLRYVENAGGACEDAGDVATVLLPAQLREAFGLPEEVRLTDDPEVAEEEGAILLIPGHPALEEAAERVLREGDAGYGWLPWPRSAHASGETLLGRARERIGVDHGRLDAAGEPRPAYLPVLRGGALVTYAFNDRFQEQVEVWVDARTGLPLPEEVERRLAGAEVLPVADTGHPAFLPEWVTGLRGMQEFYARRADRRGEELARQVQTAREQELAQVETYYQAQLKSIAGRREKAPPERQALLDHQAEVTRAEQARRLREVADKYRPHWEIRPFRLRLLLVPGMILSVRVRRGERGFPLVLHWFLPGGSFAAVRCPACGRPAPLVAGRDALGCAECLPRADAPAAKPAVQPPEARTKGKGLAAVVEPEQAKITAAKGRTAADATDEKSEVKKKKPAKPKPAPSTTPPSEWLEPWEKHQVELKMFKAGRKLDFWRAVAGGTFFPLPSSPLSSLYRLYGKTGVWVMMGVDPADIRQVRQEEEFQQGVIAQLRLGHHSGHLLHRQKRLPYTLRWRWEGGRALPTELLPFNQGDGRFLPERSKLDGEIISHLYTSVPNPSAADLDDVATALWSRLPHLGLPLVLRCLTLWWRAGAGPVPAEPPAVSAAALVQLVGRWSGSNWSGNLPPEDLFGVSAKTVSEYLRSRSRRLLQTGLYEPW